jgi:uncharacterized damage-inducible protein DinB
MALLADILYEFRRHKAMVDRAISGIDDEAFFLRRGEAVNPIALIVKHMAGNLMSRWTDFLTADGEKPGRDRDSEFVVDDRDTRAALLAKWEAGWGILFAALEGLTEADLARTVTIRSESHTAQQAILRALTHAAYHVGQILYLARLARPDAPWQTMPLGASPSHTMAYRKPL